MRADYRMGLILSLLALICAPAGTENPKVSLKLDNATLTEAAAQLSKASGIQVEVYQPELPAGAQPRPMPAQDVRASFAWSNITFGRALRQLCDTYNVRPNRRIGVYLLHPSFAAAAGPPPKRVGLVEKNGMRLFARSVYIHESRGANFIGDNPPFNNSQLSLQISCELGDGDAETIAGVQNVTAKDDLGNLLASQERASYGGYSDGAYPDEWTGGVSLPSPHPKAKKLQWLEGDLMAYQSVKALRVELPLPEPGRNARKQVGEMIFVVSQYQPAAREADEEEGLPRIGLNAQRSGPSMRVRVYTPVSGIASRSGWGYQPVMAGATGKLYTPNMRSSSGWGNGQFQLSDMSLVFPSGDDQPVKLIWDLVERSEPVKLFSFRMTDIPLPAPDVFVPRQKAPPPAPGQPAPPADQPYYQKGGGTLVTRTQFQDRPAGEGILQIGLAPRTATGWGTLRWTEVPVSPDGTARLEDIKPGAYRLLRVYKPKDAPAGGAPGRWLNAAVVVTLAPGKEATPPPLQWVAGAPTPKR
jgi:hypothetical protein